MTGVMPETPAHVDADRALAVWGWQRETLIIDELDRLRDEAVARRDGHVRSLYDTDLTYRDIGALLGVSAARVGQIMDRAKSRPPND